MKSFLVNFCRHLAIFSGHTGRYLGVVRPDRVVALDQIKVEMVLALYVFIFNRPLLYVKR